MTRLLQDELRCHGAVWSSVTSCSSSKEGFFKSQVQVYDRMSSKIELSEWAQYVEICVMELGDSLLCNTARR